MTAMIRHDTRQGGYVVDPNWSDQSYRRRIDEYYGVPPYGGV